jgi:hypothetical protein
MLALVQAPRLVDPNLRSQPCGLRKLLQLRMQIALSICGARWPWRIGWSGVVADKDVAFK